MSASPGARPVLRRYRSVALVVAWRNLHNFFLNPSLLIPSIIFPLFFFTAFAGGLSRVEDLPNFDFRSGYTAFQFSFVLMQASAFGGVFTGFAIARDFESGFGRRMMLAAPRRSGLLAGYALSALVRALFIQALLFVIALAAGMQVDGGAIDVVGMIALALMINVIALMWAAGIAFRFRSIQAGPLMQTPVFLALFMAPVYLPLDLLEGWVHAVATVNPLTLVMESLRGLISGEPFHTGAAFAVAAGMGGLFVGWALRGLRCAELAGG
ncbi:MAG: ABC transporter permease [Thermoleophilaceae bacterium]|nr:ABC transporter permease [Thermoleophilaceae bacterium]